MLLFVVLQLLVLNSISLHAALWDRLNFNESNLTSDFTIHIVQKCFLQDDHTVALIGDVPEVVVKKLHSSEFTATASLGSSRLRTDEMYKKMFHSKSIYLQTFWIRLQRVVHAFVVAAPSQPLLRRALERAKTSVWWNSAAFFIVTGTFEDNDCKNAFNYLWTLWQMGILYSIFLCKDDHGSLAMYGYSPYYDGHSKAWRKIEVHGGRGGHPWALLKLKQVHDVNVCEKIAFDKVKSLGGHPIRVGVLLIPPTLVINNGGENWLEKYVGEDAMFIHIIWQAMNGSVQTTRYTGNNPIGFSGVDQPYTGFMADVTEGRVDHGMNGLFPDIHWRVRSTYPHAASGVHLLTPSQGNMPTWLKFATIYKMPVAIGFCATLSIATIFIRYVDRRPWSAAIMDVLRATLSVTMLRLPKKFSSRILWSTIFVVLLVIASTFQGLLISLLTKPMAYRNIDGIDDMLASGYPIYGYAPFKTFFHDSKLSSQFHVDDGTISCHDSVAKGRPIAYASEYMYLRSITMTTEQCHISKQSVAQFYTGYLTRMDWPLFTRFNTLVQRLFNAGITEYWREYYRNQIARENWAQMRNIMPPNLKVLSVADLAFVFDILIVGLLCSAAIFVIEIILARSKHRD